MNDDERKHIDGDEARTMSGKNPREAEDLAPKDPDQRMYRKSIESKLALDTAFAVKDLQASVVTLTQQHTEMRGWLMGSVSKDGQLTPGILSEVKEARARQNVTNRLLWAIFSATVAKTCGDWFGGFAFNAPHAIQGLK